MVNRSGDQPGMLVRFKIMIVKIETERKIEIRILRKLLFVKKWIYEVVRFFANLNS